MCPVEKSGRPPSENMMRAIGYTLVMVGEPYTDRHGRIARRVCYVNNLGRAMKVKEIGNVHPDGRPSCWMTDMHKDPMGGPNKPQTRSGTARITKNGKIAFDWDPLLPQVIAELRAQNPIKPAAPNGFVQQNFTPKNFGKMLFKGQ